MQDGIDPDHDVILRIDDSTKFIMRIDEALKIAMMLNGCMRAKTSWVSGVQKSRPMLEPPTDVASIVPITTAMRVEWEQTRKLIEEKK